MIDRGVRGVAVCLAGIPDFLLPLAEAFDRWSAGVRFLFLVGELFTFLFLVPFVFLRAGLFPPRQARLGAAIVGGIFYAFLPDPIDVFLFDDLFFLALLFFFLCADQIGAWWRRRRKGGDGGGR
ncbi:MAG: hypothetical protein D6795_15365 [Deltaproteobacteria bacterium]|nr:MAG: hypothetical protein D6795_15365 [Deltaproteobacteria bacterium]